MIYISLKYIFIKCVCELKISLFNFSITGCCELKIPKLGGEPQHDFLGVHLRRGHWLTRLRTAADSSEWSF